MPNLSFLNKNKIVLFFVYLYPISLTIGPAVSETIILLCILFFYKILRKNLKLILEIKIFKLLIFFYIYLLFSSLLGFDVIYSLKTSLPYIRHIVFAFLIYLLLENKKLDKNILFWSLFIFILFLIVDLFIQFNFGKNLFGYEKVGHFRYGGIFDDELVLGSYLLKISPVFLTLLYLRKYKYSDYLCLFSLVILCSATLLTGERTSFFLSCLLFLSLFVFLRIKFIHKFLILVFVLLSGLIFLNINNNQNVKDRIFNSTFQSIFKDKKIIFFTENHEKLYNASFKMFLDKPLTGHGPKSFRKICKLEKFYVNYRQACQTHPHNIYLQILAETGLVGLTFLVLLFFDLLRIVFFGRILDENQTYEKKIFFILTIGLFINLFPLAPTGNFFNNWYSMLLYFILPYLIYFKKKYNFDKL